MAVTAIDHVAVPIRNVAAMRAFYETFGFGWDATSAPHLYAVTLAKQKINFHDPSLWQNPKFTLRGPTATPGCGDFCFSWNGKLEELQQLLHELNLTVIEGPVERVGGAAVGTSVYVRDPDGNLVEFILYDDEP